MAQITVGKSKIIDKRTGKARAYRYSDIPTGAFGTPDYEWVIDLTYLPIPYDLMHLKIEDAVIIKSGWWTGHSWKGLHLKRQDKIIKWKRNHEHD